MNLHHLLPAALLLATHPATSAAPLPTSLDPAQLAAYLEATTAKSNIVGLSVAIYHHGQPLLVRGFGPRSLHDRRPVQPDTLFAIGSVTKQFTCACILLLAEDGQLSVHDRVARWYPALTRAQDISLLDLMNHTSGYRDYYPLDYVDRRMQQPIDPDQLLCQYAGGPLDFEPGSKYSYSNTGYILLGRVVEKVSGQSFGDFLAARILRPLRLQHTLYEPAPDDSRLAQGYATFALSNPEPIAPEAPGWIGAAGGIFSTPSDLATWSLALLQGRVLKPESYALMTARRPLTDGRLSDYGCGLMARNQGGRDVLTHNGAVSGFNATSAFVPSTQSAIVLLTNVEGGLGNLPADLLNLITHTPALIPDIAGPPAPEAARLLFLQYQRGRVDRTQLSDEFNHFLTPAKLAQAARRLKRLGTPRHADLLSRRERGGMEVSVCRIHCKSGTLRTLMYRQPNGRIEQFFVDAE